MSLDVTGEQKRQVPVMLPVVVNSCLATKYTGQTNSKITLKIQLKFICIVFVYLFVIVFVLYLYVYVFLIVFVILFYVHLFVIVFVLYLYVYLF
jgi:uncharacterized membrane protein